MMSICAATVLAACGKSPPEASVPAATKTHTATASPPATAAVVSTVWRARLPTISPEQVPDILKQATAALANGQLERGGSPGPGALELYLSVLVIDPTNQPAQAGVQSCLLALFDQGRIAMIAGRLADADRVEDIAHSVQPESPDLVAYRKSLVDAHAADLLVGSGQALAVAGKIVSPKGDNAWQSFQQALRIVPGFVPALEGIRRWHAELLKMAWQSASADDFRGADQRLLEAHRMQVDAGQESVMGLRIVELRQARSDALFAQGNAAVDALQLDRADKLLVQAEKIAAQPAGADALRERIHLARHYGPFKPGEYFSDALLAGGNGPEMVVIRYGRYTMGSLVDEPEREANEGPTHQVDFVRGFAIARNEVTVADFARFIVATGYQTLATRVGHSTVYDEKGGVMSEHDGVDWRRDHLGRIAAPALPVVHISFADALAYANWLSGQSRQRYRLPSEAEFEYTLRAGSADPYAWGAGPPNRLVGNLSGAGDQSETGRHWDNAILAYRDAFWGAAPVRSFPMERFGTFDMIGNVSEWTDDCWHDSYLRAPEDGSAWVNPGCEQRVVRGASWASSLEQARSAFRLPTDANTTNARLGFRVVREL